MTSNIDDMSLLVDRMVIDDEDNSCGLSCSAIQDKMQSAEKHNSGLCIRAFNEAKSQLFTVPSQTVEVTQGSYNFVEDYKVNGPFSKNRFHVCADYMEGQCRKGRQCADLHIPPDSRSSEIHANRTPTENYDRLREGYLLTVLDTVTKLPNSYNSETLFFTRGAAQYLDQWDETGSVPPQKLHRCIHYEQSKICHFGKLCNFVHAAGPPSNNKDVDPNRKCATAAAPPKHAAPPPSYFQSHVAVNQPNKKPQLPQQPLINHVQTVQQHQQMPQLQTIIHQVQQQHQQPQHQVVVLQQSPTSFHTQGVPQTQYIIQQAPPQQYYPHQVIYTNSAPSHSPHQQQFPQQQHIVVVRQDSIVPQQNEKHIIYTTAPPPPQQQSNTFRIHH